MRYRRPTNPRKNLSPHDASSGSALAAGAGRRLPVAPLSRGDSAHAELPDRARPRDRCMAPQRPLRLRSLARPCDLESALALRNALSRAISLLTHKDEGG